jgi:hypothetical protein
MKRVLSLVATRHLRGKSFLFDETRWLLSRRYRWVSLLLYQSILFALYLVPGGVGRTFLPQYVDMVS